MTLPTVLAGLGVKSPRVPNSCGYFQLNLKNAEFLLFPERMWLRWPIAHLDSPWPACLTQAAWSRIRHMYVYIYIYMATHEGGYFVLLISCCYDDDCLLRWRCLVNGSVSHHQTLHFLPLCFRWPFLQCSHGIVDLASSPGPSQVFHVEHWNIEKLGRAWGQC